MSLDVMKGKLREIIMGIRESEGTQKARAKASEFLLESHDAAKKLNNFQAASVLRGELAEIYLEICLRDYIDSHPQTFYVKGLCVKRQDGKEGFTELDLTLFKQDCILLFESKSYYGEKELKEECSIYQNGKKKMDVFRQNEMHLDNLRYYVDRFATANVKPRYKLVYFSFADEIVNDKRNSDWKSRIPFTNDSTIDKFLEQKHANEKWNMEALWKEISKLHEKSPENFKKHLKMVGA